jgi:putative component of membrane protein insertase Oxa1/YidC/SpoIIIJ protein YidD
VEECNPFSTGGYMAPGTLAKASRRAVEECNPFSTGGYMAPGTLAKASRRAVEECKDCPWLKLKC